MILSANPELICLRLVLPADVAGQVGTGGGGIEARHEFERFLQKNFFDLELASLVHDGTGTLESGSIIMLTDEPALTLSWLNQFLTLYRMKDGLPLRRYCSLRMLDRENNIFRTVVVKVPAERKVAA